MAMPPRCTGADNGSPHDPLGLSAEPAATAAMFIRQTGLFDHSGIVLVHMRLMGRLILCREPKGDLTDGIF